MVNPHTQHDCHPDRHGDQEHPGPEPAGHDPGQVRVPGVHPNVNVVPLERPAAFGADRVEYTIPEPAMRTGETGIGLCSDRHPVHIGLRNQIHDAREQRNGDIHRKTGFVAFPAWKAVRRAGHMLLSGTGTPYFFA